MLDDVLWPLWCCRWPGSLLVGLEPLLAGVGLCQAREVEAWRDGMALGISSGCTVPFRVEVLVEGCWFFVPPPLTLPCEGSLWLLLRIKAIRGGCMNIHWMIVWPHNKPPPGLWLPQRGCNLEYGCLSSLNFKTSTLKTPLN